MLPTLLLVSTSLAAGYSVDIELLRPGFSGAPPGLDSPEVLRRGAFNVGGLVQYQLNPLVLAENGDEVGAVVANRFTLAVGASAELSKRFAVRGSLPVAYSFGSEVGALQADGFGTGDLSAGVRFELVSNDLLALGLHGDLMVPISSPGGYSGEESLRVLPGVAFAVHPGEFRALVDTTVTLRGEVPTQQSLTMGHELAAGLDLSYALLDGMVRPHVFAVSRLGLQSEFSSAGSIPVELMGGASVRVAKRWTIDAYGGRGLTAGYGATDARVALGLNYRQLPPKTVVETVALPVYTAEVSDDELDKIIEVEPEPEPEPEAAPLAEVTQAEIVIRDMLQFEVGNDRLVPTSIPTLQAVAQLLNDNPDIQTLVVEGHASGEGTFESNYELSVRRSLAVFRELVKLDVHPSRLAIRGFGEVVPLVEGDDTKNRRVVFSIARRLAPNEPNPGWSTEVTLPWSGEARAIPAAKLPELAPVVPDKRAPKVEESTIDKSHFDEEDDD